VSESRGRRIDTRLLLPGLGLLLVASVLVALAVGTVSIGPGAVLGIVLDHLGIGTGLGFTETQDAVLWSIRLPRVMLAALVGAGLAVAGVGFQGIFRNPLADPQVIGISSGAALGAVLAILVGEFALGGAAGPIGGVAGALVAVTVVYRSARHEGRTEVVTLVLAGFAVAAIGSAGAGFVSVAADDPRLGSALFYTLGSLSVATWRLVWFTLPFVLIGMLVMPLTARRLDLVLLGEREATHLGVDVGRLRATVAAAGVLIVGGAVAATGVIGFVGLLVPHGIRLVAGPGHRTLIPASALGGAVLVVMTDLVARTVASPLEVPVGLLTALLGGPVFLWLLVRTRREHGGWG
jgi:iron complex transport system permease protein